MKFIFYIIFVTLITMTLNAIGCRHVKDDFAFSYDADVSTDMDVDSDVDAGDDIDGGPDSDVDVDVDADGDSDSDSDNDIDVDTDSDSDSDTDRECFEGDTQCHGEMVQRCSNLTWKNWDDCEVQEKVCAIIGGDAVCFASIDTDTDIDTDIDADTDADNDIDIDTDTDTDIDKSGGHIVVIGHDYYESNWQADDLVGNAVFLSSTPLVRILAYSEYADVDREKPNVDNAIEQRASELGREWARTEINNYNALGAEFSLLSYDVFLVYEQENADQGQMAVIGAAWSEYLEQFLNLGGIVIISDGYSDGWGSGSNILYSAGLSDFQTGGNASEGRTLTIVNPKDTITDGLTHTYASTNSTNYYTESSQYHTVVEDSERRPVVLHRVFASGDADVDTDADTDTDTGNDIDIGTVLIYYDVSIGLDALRASNAAEALGLDVMLVYSSGFNEIFDAGGFEMIIWDSCSSLMPEGAEGRLISWINKGGPLIFSYWNLDDASFDLHMALGVSPSTLGQWSDVYSDPAALFDFFDSVQTIPSPLTGQGDWVDNGDTLNLLGNGFISARFDSNAGPGAIAVTNNGNVLVNGFLPDNCSDTDNDLDGIPDMQEIYENQIQYVISNI
ncbi:MAG: hypothetical protein GY847_15420 [Proteobacteria bacterium]|nr:hypothetical protein [Pseudomonadota bacterium]